MPENDNNIIRLHNLLDDVEDMDYDSQRREIERLHEELMNLQRMIDERDDTKIERTGVKL